MNNMQDTWPSTETFNQFILYIGGLFAFLYLVTLFVFYTQRRCQPVVVWLSNPDESENVYEYILTVKTSLLPGSGCSPTTNVFIQLHGEFGNSPSFLLKKYSETQNILSRGALDIYVLHTADYLGDIASIGIHMVDEIHDKSVWRPTKLELYNPSQQTWWTSPGISKLVCLEELETHVMMSKRTSRTRKWLKEFLTSIVSYHQWLSMTIGGTTFGIFTSFLNLQLFFCCLAMIFTANVICLLIVEDINSDFDITIEKFFGCVIVTLLVGGVSWIIETLARNAKPCSKITKDFQFSGLHELKKQNLVNERMYEEIDSDVDEEELNALHLRNSVQNVNNHAIMQKDSEEDFGTFHQSKKHEQYQERFIHKTNKSNNAKASGDENKHLRQKMFSCCYQKQEPDIESDIAEPDIEIHPKCGNLTASFSDPLELSEYYAVSLMTFMKSFSVKTLDNAKVVGHFQTLHQTVSKDLLRMLTEHDRLLYFMLVVSGSPTDWFREFDYKAMCEEDKLSFNAPEPFYKHPLEESDLKRKGERKGTHVGNGDNLEVVNLNQEIHHVKEKTRTSDVEIMGSHWTYVPLYLFCQKDYMLFDYCKCMSEHCRKCTQLMSKVKGLSFLILKNSFVMIMETSIKTWFSQPESILKMLTDMLYLFVNSGMALIMEEHIRMELDESTLIIDCVAAVIVHEALINLYKKECEAEDMEQIRNVSKLFVTDLVQSVVKELKVEYSLQNQVKDLCEHAIQAASDEALNEFHDPVYVFGEQMLKETLTFEINCMRGGDGETKGKDQLFEMLHQATLPWQEKLSELPLSAEALLIQSLIEIFETSVFKMSDLYEHLTECLDIERQVGKVCTEAADSFINPLLKFIQSENSETGWKSTQLLTCHMEVYIGHNLTEYVDKVKAESHTLLYEQLLELMSRSVVKMAVVKAKLTWLEELELQSDEQTDTEPTQDEEITELRNDFLPLRNYLKAISRTNKERDKKELSQHIKRVSKKQKEYVSITLQNTVDFCSAVDDLPREYTDEELYVVEWFVTDNLCKALPAGIKPALNFFMLSTTVLAMAYFVSKGGTLSTAQTQEWACLVLISCVLFGFVLEPLKVLIMMLMENTGKIE